MHPIPRPLVVAALSVSLLLALVAVLPSRIPVAAAASPTALTYQADGSFALPRDYREWVFLSSGIDMVYGPAAAPAPGHSIFDNVFVNPSAYRRFLADGTWPDGTVLVVEIRGAERDASINRVGQTQGSDVHGIEVHLKDAARFPGKWAFFDVNPAGIGKFIPQTADCYTCHRDHAAVDTTFVQFYPTLLPIAKAKGTLSPAYLAETAAPKPKP